MEANKTLYQFNFSDDYFLHRLEHMNQQLKALADIMDENNRIQRYGRPPYQVLHKHQWVGVPQKRTPALMWPFSMLAQCIDGLLNRFDQAVGKWVQSGVIGRLMRRLLFWLKKRKRA